MPIDQEAEGSVKKADFTLAVRKIACIDLPEASAALAKLFLAGATGGEWVVRTLRRGE